MEWRAVGAQSLEEHKDATQRHQKERNIGKGSVNKEGERERDNNVTSADVRKKERKKVEGQWRPPVGRSCTLKGALGAVKGSPSVDAIPQDVYWLEN